MHTLLFKYLGSSLSLVGLLTQGLEHTVIRSEEWKQELFHGLFFQAVWPRGKRFPSPLFPIMPLIATNDEVSFL